MEECVWIVSRKEVSNSYCLDTSSRGSEAMPRTTIVARFSGTDSQGHRQQKRTKVTR
jgi:hypothetical protein